MRCTEDAWDLIRWLSERGRDEIGFDTETTGLDKRHDRVRLVQIADEMTGWAIPFERWSGLVEDIVDRFQGYYDMHNAVFDQPMLAKEGIKISTSKIHDTKIMAHVLSSTSSLGLKPLGQRYVDPGAAMAQQVLNEGIGRHGGWTFETVPVSFEPYWVYGALDAVLTRRLKNELLPRVTAEAVNSYHLEMQVMWICEQMEQKGAPVDHDYTADLLQKYTAYVSEVEQWCDHHYGVPPGSDLKLVQYFQDLGFRWDKRTKGGRPSLDKEVLAEIDHPLAEAVLGRRQALKLVSTTSKRI